MLAPVLLAALLAARPSIPWTNDYTKALSDAQEQRRPLLLFFR
jgi:hypothetical protein